MATRRRAKSDAPTLPLGPAPIDAVDAAEIIAEKYRTYALYVVGDRALPDVRDGLKPVHRRILWGMLTMSPSATADRPHQKCARIVGAVIGLFHPHGDSAVYEALVRLARPFALRAPLVDFHGNYGSPDFGPASSRYTEARLNAASNLLLAEVRAGTVDLIPNYDSQDEEPVVLPAAFPNWLVNGSYGIAVGMSSFMLPHNPREVCEAALTLIRRDKTSVDELCEIVKGPDFPDPAVIVNVADLPDIYRSGSGAIKVRGTWEFDDGPRLSRIVVTSLPYADGSTGSGKRFVEDAVAAIGEGRLAGIDDIIDETAEGRLRIVVVLSRGADRDTVLAGLLKYTNLQVTNSVRMNALDAHGVPQTYNLRTALEAWIQHRIEVIDRRSRRRLAWIADRLHVLDGLLAVLLDIDAAIAIIRGSDDVAEARGRLKERFSIDDVQANFVLDLTLRRLTRLAQVEVEREAAELRTEQAGLEDLVSSDANLRKQVGVELKAAAKVFEGVGRTTVIDAAAVGSFDALLTPGSAEALAALPDVPTTVHVTADRAVCTLPPGKTLPTGAEGRSFDTTTRTQVIVYTVSGQMHRVAAGDLPKKPVPLDGILGLKGDAVLDVYPAALFADEILIATSGGSVKRVAPDELVGGDRKGGIATVKLDEGETVVAVLPCTGNEFALFTSDGQGIRFEATDVRPMGRAAAGVRGVKLAGGERVVGAVNTARATQIALAHRSGAAKKFDLAELPVQGRGGRGVRVSVATGRHGKVAFGATAGPLLYATPKGMLRIEAASWKAVGREAAPTAGRVPEGDARPLVG
jgi:DNA gyrase subunit A